MAKSRFSAAQVTNAIEGTGAIISDIAERLGCTRTEVYEHLNRYPDAKDAFEAEKEALGDLCERAAIKLIREGHAATVHLYLKTRYKNRGFSDKPDKTEPADVNIEITRRMYEGKN